MDFDIIEPLKINIVFQVCYSLIEEKINAKFKRN